MPSFNLSAVTSRHPTAPSSPCAEDLCCTAPMPVGNIECASAALAEANKNLEETAKCAKDKNAEVKPKPRRNTSNNSGCHSRIPFCQRRQCACVTECCTDPQGMYCRDPCCCDPCLPTPFTENKQLRDENRELRKCIKRVKKHAMGEACAMLQDMMVDCQCNCCKARTKLKPCKSVIKTTARETWMSVPEPIGLCGGYTPSGWGKLLKKCQEATCEESPCIRKVVKPSPCMCLPTPKQCPPCPHLCAFKSLPAAMRPFTPCCPYYFPTACCDKDCCACGLLETPKPSCDKIKAESCTPTPAEIIEQIVYSRVSPAIASPIASPRCNMSGSASPNAVKMELGGGLSISCTPIKCGSPALLSASR